MATVIKIEGREIPVDPVLAETDDGVIRILAPFYPQASTATIKRSRDELTGNMVIDVEAKPGRKG